jgi:opacity protein-like surface antigen
MVELFAIVGKTRRACGPLIRVGLVVAAVIGASQVAAQAPPQQGWQFQLTPYAQVGSVEGIAELGLTGGGFVIDPGGVLDPLRAGGMLELEGRHASRFGFRLRYTLVDADGREAGGAEAHFDQNIAEVLASYQLVQRPDGQGRLELYGGLRHWDVDVHVDAAGGLLRSADWSDAIIGLRWQRQLSPGVSVLLEGDVGGFGRSNRESWSVMGGVVLQRWQQATLHLMYRGIGVDYSRGSPGTAGYFRQDTVTHGLLAGVGLKF